MKAIRFLGILFLIAPFASAQSYTFSTLTTRIEQPSGIAVDAAGNVYVGSFADHSIRKITAAGVITPFAGLAGTSGSADGPGGSARFHHINGVTVDHVGNVFVADWGNHTVRKISPEGVVSTLAGLAGSAGYRDGVSGEARFYNPAGVAVDAAGNLYVAENWNPAVRKVTPSGVVSTVAGMETARGLAGGSNIYVPFSTINGIAIDSVGNLYVTDGGRISEWSDGGNHTIRKITPAGIISILAGDVGRGWSADGSGSSAWFRKPQGVAVDSNGNVFVADTFNGTIRRIAPTGVVSTVAGRAGQFGSADGPGGVARFRHPYALAVDRTGTLFVSDEYDNSVRKGIPSPMPCIMVQPPPSPYVGGGQTWALQVTAIGLEPLSFQWFKDGEPISDATNSVLVFSRLSRVDAGWYTVVVSNPAGSIASDVSVLTVHNNLSYKLTDLGTLGLGRDGLEQSAAYALNNSGQIVGGSSESAFLWSGGVMTKLPLYYSTSASATAINDAGQVVGNWQAGTSIYGAFLYSKGAATILDANPRGNDTWASEINDSGLIVGTNDLLSRLGFSRACFWTEGRQTLLTVPVSAGLRGDDSSATAVNNRGEIVVCTQGGRAFLYANGEMNGLVSPFGWTAATDINDRGQIVGSASFGGGRHAFLYTDGVMRDLGKLGGHTSSRATGINASGEIVGFSSRQQDGYPTTERAFIYAGGVMSDLNDLAEGAPNWVFLRANAINDCGQIVGSGTTPLGYQHAFLLTPITSSRLSNFSVRTTVGVGQLLAAGFHVAGGGRDLLLRAIGPGLAPFLPATTPPAGDPRLELYDRASALVEVNDNWVDSPALRAALVNVGAFALAGHSLDATVLRNLAGRHTVQWSATSSGVSLLEIYDVGTGIWPRLVNVSAQILVGATGDAPVAGFVVAGTRAKTVLLRAVGPTLAQFRVNSPVVDPRLQLFEGATLLAENDNWGGTIALSAAFAEAGAFALPPESKDAALIIRLPPGGYTVVISGVGNVTGTALVEIYDLDP